ncbi:mucin-binding protein [Secundilactobacillus odoratitofui]|nr:BspA family leucine-rich repeat surface protein [Secundilactobacillus odoratitofui]
MGNNTDKTKRAINKLQHDEQKITVRKKLYKAGKLWVVAGIATTAFGVASISNTLNASADTADTALPTTTVTTPTTTSTSSTTVKMADKTSIAGTQSAKSTDTTEPTAQNTTVATATTSSVSAATDTASTDASSTQPSSTVKQTAKATQPTMNVETTPDTTQSVTAEPSTKVASVTQTAKATQNLGTADETTIAAVKKAAAQTYLSTGQAQKVTQVAATVTGTLGSTTYDLDDNGLLTIHAGVLDTPVQRLAAKAAIKSIYVEEGVKVDVTGNDYAGMFGQLANVVSIDAHNLDVSSVNGFGGWFTNDVDLTSLNISGWNTSSAKIFSNMFYNTQSLKTLDVSGLDTSNATAMSNMFAKSGLATLDISNFNMQNVAADTDRANMLGNMTSLSELTLGPGVNMSGTNLPDAPAAGTAVANDGITNVTVAALWQAVGAGTASAPEGTRLTAADLIALYNGTTAAGVATYVWAQDLSNSVNLVDASTGVKVTESTVSGELGDTIDFTTELPTGYHYATGDELGSYTQPVAPVIGASGTTFTVYVVADPVINISYVDATDGTVLTAKTSGALNSTSDYTTTADLATLAAKGYTYVSDNLPKSLTFDAETANYTVNVKHTLTTVSGKDATTQTQKRVATIIINASTIGTTLTSDQIRPTGPITQDLTFYRDAVIDEALKAQGAPASEYTSYGDWKTDDVMVPVVTAQVTGYYAAAKVINLDTLWDDSHTILQLVTSVLNQAGGDFSYTISYTYTILSYPVAVQYVDQTTGEVVGQTEKLTGEYQAQLAYPVIAPTGYVVVPGQDGIVNNKMILTYGPDLKTISIYVTPAITNQYATVSYKDVTGKTIAIELLNGDSNTAIQFDTADYVAKSLPNYTVVTDETTSGAIYDDLTDTVQNFNVTVAAPEISTLVTPTDTTGQPIPGNSATKVTGQPGDDITNLPQITGYVLVPGQTPRISQVDGAVTTVYYIKDAPRVTTKTITKTVHYYDMDMNELAPDFTDTAVITQSIDAATGEATYTTTDDILAGNPNPAIKGYTVYIEWEDATTDQKVTFDSKDIDTYTAYLKDAPTKTTKTITKTVHYVDADGNQLAPDFTDTAVITKSVDAATDQATFSSKDDQLAGQANPTFKGYTVIQNDPEAAATQTATFDANDVAYTIVYAKDEAKTTTKTITKTVHYVDEAGNQVAPDFTDTVTITESTDPVTGAVSYSPEFATLGFQVTPTITGYTVVNAPAEVSVTQTVSYDTASQTYTVTYKKDASDTTTTPSGNDGGTITPNDVTTPSSDNDTPTNVTPVTPTPTSETTVTTPETDENQTTVPDGKTNTPDDKSSNTVIADKSASGTTQIASVTVANDTVNQTNQSNSPKVTQLPQTSEQSSVPMVVIGMALLAEMGVLSYGFKKQHGE